ncbi:MAG: AMP nucleosidase, partial [Pseudomonadota bacterium]
MDSGPTLSSPPDAGFEAFSTGADAVARLTTLYLQGTTFLRDRFAAMLEGETLPNRCRAYYPMVRLSTSTFAKVDSRLSFGHVAEPGEYATTNTRPDL